MWFCKNPTKTILPCCARGHESQVKEIRWPARSHILKQIRWSLLHPPYCATSLSLILLYSPPKLQYLANSVPTRYLSPLSTTALPHNKNLPNGCLTRLPHIKNLPNGCLRRLPHNKNLPNGCLRSLPQIENTFFLFSFSNSKQISSKLQNYIKTTYRIIFFYLWNMCERAYMTTLTPPPNNDSDTSTLTTLIHPIFQKRCLTTERSVWGDAVASGWKKCLLHGQWKLFLHLKWSLIQYVPFIGF